MCIEKFNDQRCSYLDCSAADGSKERAAVYRGGQKALAKTAEILINLSKVGHLNIIGAGMRVYLSNYALE